MTLFSDTSTLLEEVSIDYDNKVAIYDDYYDDMYAIKSDKSSMLLDHVGDITIEYKPPRRGRVILIRSHMH